MGKFSFSTFSQEYQFIVEELWRSTSEIVENGEQEEQAFV